MAEQRLHVTVRKNLSLWDAGEIVSAFQVESDNNEQETIWGAAIDRLAGRQSPPPPEPFTKRERDVIDSIVFVATTIGWRKMVSQHVHERSPAIQIRKPRKPAEEQH